MFKIFKTEKKLTIEEVEKIEREIGLIFPMEYKEHLLKYNGGKCEPNEFSFFENGVLETSAIDWFLAIYDGDGDNLLEYINILKIEEKRIPNSLIPIATDDCGNIICISCEGKDCGSVYFWDHEKEIDYNSEDDSNWSNLYLISPSFNEFIKNLR